MMLHRAYSDMLYVCERYGLLETLKGRQRYRYLHSVHHEDLE